MIFELLLFLFIIVLFSLLEIQKTEKFRAKVCLDNKLVSNDSKVGAINITIKLPGIMRETEVPEVGEYINKAIAQAEINYPELNFYATGQIMMNNTLVEASQYDLGVLFPITLLIIILGIYRNGSCFIIRINIF